MNKFKEALESGRPALGISVLYEAPGIVESFAGQGWDWYWIDGQHSVRQHTWLEHIRACEIAGIEPLLRVPSNAVHFITGALDLGVWNVIVPMIESAEQARDAVKAAFYPPLGRRSALGTRPAALYGWDYIEMVNRSTMVVAQIETRAGMENLDQIAAVPGIGSLHIGTVDLCLSMGVPLDERNSSRVIKEAIEKVGQAARDNGKYAGIICEPEEIPLLSEEGYSFFALSMTPSLISNHMRQLLERAHRAMGQTPA